MSDIHELLLKTGKLDKELDAGRLFNTLRTTFLGKKNIPKEIKVKMKIAENHIWRRSYDIVSEKRKQDKRMEMEFIRTLKVMTVMDHIRN